MNRIGIFLDRDGTVNEEIDFLSSPHELRLIPGSADAIRKANELGAKVVIVTNQSGVARGFLSEEQLHEVHARLQQMLSEAGARVDAFYYCPHHPEAEIPPYRMVCNCRKPNTGMLLRAAAEFDIDLEKSFTIGDKMIDVQTGLNAGTTTVLVLTGYGKQELALCNQHQIRPDHVAENLYDAVQHVQRMLRIEQPSTP